MSNKKKREEALSYIGGSIEGDKIVYYDDATSSYYEGPLEDLDYLVDCLEMYPQDAYSHWCAVTSHFIRS